MSKVAGSGAATRGAKCLDIWCADGTSYVVSFVFRTWRERAQNFGERNCDLNGRR